MNHLKTSFLSYIRIVSFTFWLLLFAGATLPADAKIVFCVDGDIFVSNDDGSRRRRLTHNTTAFDAHPRWSPDGKRIAFTRYLDKTKSQTTAEVFVMNADGTDPQRLTYNNVLDVDSSWSPDGRYIAISSTRTDSWEVFVIEVATHTITQITGIEGKTRSAT